MLIPLGVATFVAIIANHDIASNNEPVAAKPSAPSAVQTNLHFVGLHANPTLQ